MWIGKPVKQCGGPARSDDNVFVKGGGTIRILPARARANLVLLLVTVIWGATFSLTKAALRDISVFPLLSLRFILATVVMAMIVRGRTDSRRAMRSGRLWLIGFVLGVFLFLGYALQTLGLQTISPAVSAFLTGLNVILVPMMAIPLLHRRTSHNTWMAAGLALGGLALLNGITSLGDWSLGEIYTLGCAVFIAFQMVYMDKWAVSLDSFSLTTIEMATVALLSTVGALHDAGHWASWNHWAVWSAVLVNGLLGSAFAYWAQTRYQQVTSAAYVAVIFTMEPVFATAIAVIFLHEVLRVPVVLGGALIVGSMLLADGASSDPPSIS